jgi:hypothetical protein
MPNHNDVWTLKKYLLYDFAHDQLAGSRLFASYEEAAQAANGQATVMIVPLVLNRAQTAEGSEPCDCLRSA